MNAMKTQTNFIASPLNYTGGKFRLLPQIFPFFPDEVDRFVDLFCGGCNVGINVTAEKVDFYDNNISLLEIFRTFQSLGGETVVKKVEKLVKKYQLSDSKKHDYSYYHAHGSTGLGDYNREKFLHLRDDFNQKTRKDQQYYIMLYTLILFSFNNQIRFNAKGEFNLPVGKRDFNKNMKEKLLKFSQKLGEENYSFTEKDFRKVDFSNLTENSFVYVDPPYLISCATYNEQGGWREEHERDLLLLLDSLSEKNIKFALSNSLQSKGKTNEILSAWLKENQHRYHVHHLNYHYANSNYQTKDKTKFSQEVLILNYEAPVKP